MSEYFKKRLFDEYNFNVDEFHVGDEMGPIERQIQKVNQERSQNFQAAQQAQAAQTAQAAQQAQAARQAQAQAATKEMMRPPVRPQDMKPTVENAGSFAQPQPMAQPQVNPLDAADEYLANMDNTPQRNWEGFSVEKLPEQAPPTQGPETGSGAEGIAGEVASGNMTNQAALAAGQTALQTMAPGTGRDMGGLGMSVASGFMAGGVKGAAIMGGIAAVGVLAGASARKDARQAKAKSDMYRMQAEIAINNDRTKQQAMSNIMNALSRALGR